MDSKDLKLCPFCGDFMKLKQRKEDLSYYVECSNDSCGCGYYPVHSFNKNADKTIEDCNKRFWKNNSEE